MIDLSADAIGQTWTIENHQALVCHLKAVERLAQDVIALREREHKAALSNCNHSPVDPEAAEI